MIRRGIKAKQEIDSFSLEDLFKRYYPRLCEFAFRLLQDEQEAEDIAQEAFVVFCEEQDRFQWNDTAIKSYLYTTVKHDALNRIRHNKVVKNYQSNIHQPLLDEYQIVDAMIHSEVLGELMSALEKLPKGCATICKMGFLEGQKNHEIAEALGLSIHTVKSQKQRALSLLRQQLKPEAFTLLFLYFLK